MGDRHHGHPLGGTLIIGAIFSVALAFYLATPPATLRPTSVGAPPSLHAASITAHPPAIAPRVVATRSISRRVEPAAVVEATVVQAEAAPASVAEPVAAPEPTLRAFSWSTIPSSYPQAVEGVRGAGPFLSAEARRAKVEGPAANAGAVTHAFASAGSAIRSAFKKAF